MTQDPSEGDSVRFQAWAERWLDLARYPGAELTNAGDRINDLVSLWHEAVPGAWQRGDDPALTDRQVWYRRTHQGRPDGPVSEARIEHEVLAPDPDAVGTSCFGDVLVAGINAVSLQTNRYRGRRLGNIEADMLLLTHGAGGYRALLVEVKVSDATAWYAAVEALRQLRLYTESVAAQRILPRRRPDLPLREPLPVSAVVLAPAAYYMAPRKKLASVPYAQALARPMRERAGVDLVLATWDVQRRAVAAVG